MDNNEKKERMMNAIRLWCTEQGLNEITDNDAYYYYTDIAFTKDDKITGFIFEFDKDDEKLEFKMIFSKDICNYVYVVTDDSKKRKELLDKIIDEYGLLCYSNSFGLGYVYQIFKEPTSMF